MRRSAKGAALYGLKLSLGQRIESLEKQGMSPAQAKQTVASEMGVRLTLVDQMQGTTIINVISHSFGIRALNAMDREVISNLVIRQHPVPATEDADLLHRPGQSVSGEAPYHGE